MRTVEDWEGELDSAIHAAIDAFPAGFIPGEYEVMSDSDVYETHGSTSFARRKSWAYDLWISWRDSWSCFDTSGPCPGVDAFDEYADAIVHLSECREVYRKQCRYSRTGTR